MAFPRVPLGTRRCSGHSGHNTKRQAQGGTDTQMKIFNEFINNHAPDLQPTNEAPRKDDVVDDAMADDEKPKKK